VDPIVTSSQHHSEEHGVARYAHCFVGLGGKLPVDRRIKQYRVGVAIPKMFLEIKMKSAKDLTDIWPSTLPITGLLQMMRWPEVTSRPSDIWCIFPLGGVCMWGKGSQQLRCKRRQFTNPANFPFSNSATLASANLEYFPYNNHEAVWSFFARTENSNFIVEIHDNLISFLHLSNDEKIVLWWRANPHNASFNLKIY